MGHLYHGYVSHNQRLIRLNQSAQWLGFSGADAPGGGHLDFAIVHSNLLTVLATGLLLGSGMMCAASTGWIYLRWMG